MKKLMFGIILVMALVLTLVPDARLWCERTFLNSPQVHKIETGDYLSKISQRYYGTAKYWQELALINRAPNSNLVFPGEEVFIPSLEVVEQLHRARSLSKVNQLMNDEEQLYAHAAAPKKPEPAVSETTAAELAATQPDTAAAGTLAPVATKTSPPAASKALILLMGLGIAVVVVGVSAFIVYRKIQAARFAESLDNLPPIKAGPQKVEGRDEPDYAAYRKNRSKRVFV
jgi:hypothetical protein